jgi:serine/threonine protein phosphatase PrpC
LELMEQGRRENWQHQETVQHLIDAANQYGGDDNVSTILVEVMD